MSDTSSLLDSLIDSPQPPADGRLDFKKTMALLNLHSVFDIIRLSKTEFIEQVARHCDDDASQAYDNACGYAAQLEFLYREQALTSDDLTRFPRSTSSNSPTGPTYAALFKEDWNTFCETSSITALDSPVAYLRALHLFARQVETTGQGTGKRITLATRRPTLADMDINNQTLSRQLPLLTIVNEVLADHLKIHFAKNTDIYKNQSVNDVLAITRYPFELPFDLAHQQCLLGLSANKPGLGELNYRLSLNLPLGQAATSSYGVVFHPAYEAQRLLSGLSPEQQTLLTEPLWSEHTSAFKAHYDSDETALKKLDHFIQQTSITASQTDELLARGKYLARPSDNALPAHKNTDLSALNGVCYVNGIEREATARLDLKNNDHGPVELLNTSAERFDRLQRMIRLQRWLNLPFAQLDTLIFSAKQCEEQPGTALEINDNTLRVLGVYRYLNHRYGLQAEEFSALLYRLPIHAVANNDSLFDRIFNTGQTSEHSLKLDDSSLDLSATDVATQTALYQICGALGLSNTAESLGYVAERTRQLNGYLRKDLTTLSAFYRQVRIARLFGLSVLECAHLANLLGSANTSEQWITPVLRESGLNAPADFLDVLMQMDWAVNWLKSNASSVQQLRHQLILSHTPQSAVVSQQLKTFNELLDDIQARLIPHAEIEALELPAPSVKTKTKSKLDPKGSPMVHSWNSLIALSLVKAQPYLTPNAHLEVLKRSVSQTIADQVELSADPQKDQLLKNQILEKLEPLLLPAYQRLQPIADAITRLFKDTSHVSDTRDLLMQRLKHAARHLVSALAKPRTPHGLRHLLLLLPDADNTLQLPLTREALQVFLLNPQWLDNQNAPGSMLKLTLNTLYLFQQFNYCMSTYGVAQDVLLNYFEVSNPGPDKTDTTLLAAQCNKMLGSILNWDPIEVEGLVSRLPNKRVHSMQQLDWLMRGQSIAKITGLSSKALLMATNLPAQIANADWTLVGKAIVAAQKQ